MNIAVFNTGGTISCVGDPLMPMAAADFANACKTILNPILLKQYPKLNITYIEPTKGDPSTGWFPESTTGTLDSTNLQPSDWCIMAQYILANYAAYDGWVILHGTDSMDFTGGALPFLLSSFDENGVARAALSKPIIITGSQVPLFYQEQKSDPLTLNYNTDAYQNMCGSIALAQSGIPEVGLYFQNHLYRGNRSVKTNASEFDAFSSPNYPALAEHGIELSVNLSKLLPAPLNFDVSLDNPTVLQAKIGELTYIQNNIDSFPVMQFNAFPAWYGYNNTTGIISQLIDACVGTGIKGLILESYGEGNFPSGCPNNPQNGATYQSLLKANNAGVVIVDCTQVLSGVVNDSAYGSGAWLPGVGALNPSDMTPMTALGKLIVLLTSAGYTANNWSADQVKKLMQLSLLGEMINRSRLDSRTNSELLASEQIVSLDGETYLINDPILGPVLKNTISPTPLWSAMTSAPSSDDLPGRLAIQNDGNLVFYSRFNAPLWSTNTGVSSGASSLLSISGSYSENNLSLQVIAYGTNKITTLYQQS